MMEPENIIKYAFDQNNKIQVLQSGRICSLVLEGETVIQAQQPFADMGSGSFLMYPWVNRIEEAQPNLPPENYDGNGFPIHGMMVNTKKKIQVIEQEHKIQVTLEKNVEGVPAFQDEYTIGKGKFTASFQIVSQNSDILCFGYHPYLQINGTSLQQLKIKTNIHKNIKLDENLLPIYPFQYSNVDVNENGNYDSLFVVDDEEGGFLELIDEKREVNVSIKSKMKYWQIYTPGDRKRIAVEPMSFCGNMYKIHPQMGGELPEMGEFVIEVKK